MIDIHSHLVFDIDDGATSMEESLEMVSEAEKLGIKTIIATPHFHENITALERVKENFQKLVASAVDYGVIIKPGSEVFINPFIPSLLEKNHLLTLNSTRYMLLEFPMHDLPIYGTNTIYELQIKNIVPIIAHPERNRIFLRDANKVLDLIGRGCMIQVDAASVIGVHGREIKRFVKRLLKIGAVHFVASDAHCADGYTCWYRKAYNKVSMWVGEEYADKLFKTNARCIL